MARRPAGSRLLPFLVALPFLLRLGYFLETRSQPYFQWNFLVAYVNHTFAADLALHRGAPYALFRSPYYPLLVSWVYRLAGVEPLAMRLVQWLLGGFGCLLVFVLGSRLLGRAQATVALAAAALFVPAIWSEGELWEQSCAGFFMLAGVTVLARDGDGRPGTLRCLAGAILYGAGFLMRPDLLLAAPFLAAALAAGPGTRSERAARAGSFAAGCAFMLILLARPGLAIDVRENDAGVNAAINFYLGNNARADGHDAVFPETPELPTDDPAARADHMTGLDLAGVRYARAQAVGGPIGRDGGRDGGGDGGSMAGVAAFWRARALQFITGEPIAWLHLQGRKLALFFSGYLVGTQKDPYFMRESSLTLRALLWCLGLCAPLGLVLPLAVTGAAAAPMAASRRWLLLGAPIGALLTTLVFFHDARFLLPAAPFLILLAVAGLFATLDAIRSRRPLAPALLAAAMIAGNVDWLGVQVVNRAAEEFRVGTMHAEAGRMDEARAAWRRAIEADPSYVPAVENFTWAARDPGALEPALAFLEPLAASGRAAPPVMRAAAQLQEAAGRADQALATLRAGAARFPEDIGLALDLAERLARDGGDREALDLARRALDRAPDDPRAAALAGLCLGALGRDEEAAGLLQEARRRHPDDPTVLGLLGQSLGRLGRREEEQRCYAEILRREPGHALAAYRMALSLAAQSRYAEALPWAKQAERLGQPGAAALAAELASRAAR